MSQDSLLQDKLFLEEKSQAILNLSNAVRIDYYSAFISPAELNEHERELKEAGLELSSYDKSGRFYASLEDFTNLARIVLKDEITKDILLGAAGNFLWEVIKRVTKRAWSQLSGRKFRQYTDASSTAKALTFGIDFIVDENTGITFRLDAKLAQDDLNRVLDETIEHVRVLKPNAQYEHPLFANYDIKGRRWVIVDPIEEIRRIHFAEKPPVPPKKKSPSRSKQAKRRRTKRK